MNSLEGQKAHYSAIRKRLMGRPTKQDAADYAYGVKPEKPPPILLSIKPIKPGMSEELKASRQIKYQHALRDLQSYSDVQLAKMAADMRKRREAARQARIKAETEALVAKYRCVYDVPGDVIRDIVSPGPRQSSHEIIKAIAEAYGVTVSDIKSVRRAKHISLARQACYYMLAMERPDLSMPLIGKLLGGKDHTTVLFGIRAHAERHNLPLGSRHTFLAKKKGWRRVIQPTDFHDPAEGVHNCSQSA